MKKTLKWILIIGGGLCVVIVAALIIIPMVVDIQDYKPRIEAMVSEHTGRSFTIGGDLKLSLFPWAGISFSDLRLGNPPGFQEKQFVSIASFDVQAKLLPLLTRDIQVKRFVVEGPALVLETSKDGRGNWEGLGSGPAKGTGGAKKPASGGESDSLPLKSLVVGECAVKGGSVLWIDHGKGVRKTLSGVSLTLQDVSLDTPIRVALSARFDGAPLSLEGSVGPVGRDPAAGTISLDLVAKALDQLSVGIKGTIVQPGTAGKFDLSFAIQPFSPRALMKTLGRAFPVNTADPEALDTVSLKGSVKGSPSQVSISGGELTLDRSTLAFSVDAGDFSKPDVRFSLELDSIDLDRYLPPPTDKSAQEKQNSDGGETTPGKKTDYAPMRKPVIEGTILVKSLTARGAKINDVSIKVTGKNGRFDVNPLTLALYDGSVNARAVLDAGKDTPTSSARIDAQGIQVGPLLRDVMKKDFMEGALKAAISVTMTGDEPARIKKTLNGEGELVFQDGALVGIDLAGMVRNAKAAFGLAEKTTEKPRTDFSELRAPFTITNGVVHTPDTSMKSPLLRVSAAGDADLTTEALNLRVEPKVVATIKGQGDDTQRSGFMVPVLVTGTFSAPKFRPDLKGMLTQGLKGGVPAPSDLKKLLPDTGAAGGTEALKEKAKGLLKGLPFSN